MIRSHGYQLNIISYPFAQLYPLCAASSCPCPLHWLVFKIVSAVEVRVLIRIGSWIAPVFVGLGLLRRFDCQLGEVIFEVSYLRLVRNP